VARRHPTACGLFSAIDYFERREIPFIVVHKRLEGARRYTISDVRVG